MKILFVCLGNICRSPAAESILKFELEKKGLWGTHFCDSAGTAGYHIGKSPDDRTQKSLAKIGVKTASLARKFSSEDFDLYDLIITMDVSNFQNVMKQITRPEHQSKVKHFMSYCSQHQYTEVPDPYYGGENDFDLVTSICCDGVNGIMTAHLLKE